MLPILLVYQNMQDKKKTASIAYKNKRAIKAIHEQYGSPVANISITLKKTK